MSLPVDSLGYVEPGHGAKGKQRWLITDADVTDMYKAKFFCGATAKVQVMGELKNVRFHRTVMTIAGLQNHQVYKSLGKMKSPSD